MRKTLAAGIFTAAYSKESVIIHDGDDAKYSIDVWVDASNVHFNAELIDKTAEDKADSRSMSFFLQPGVDDFKALTESLAEWEKANPGSSDEVYLEYYKTLPMFYTGPMLETSLNIDTMNDENVFKQFCWNASEG